MTIARDEGLDLDAPENRYSVWSYDGLRPWFVGAFGSQADALAAGSKFHNTSGIYVLTGSGGRLTPLELLTNQS